VQVKAPTDLAVNKAGRLTAINDKFARRSRQYAGTGTVLIAVRLVQMFAACAGGKSEGK